MGTTGVDASAAARRCGKRAAYSRDALSAALSRTATARRTLSRWRCPCSNVLATSCSALSALRLMYSGAAETVVASAAVMAAAARWGSAMSKRLASERVWAPSEASARGGCGHRARCIMIVSGHYRCPQRALTSGRLRQNTIVLSCDHPRRSSPVASRPPLLRVTRVWNRKGEEG